MYGLEIIGSLVACVLLSGFAFLLARKSFTSSDGMISKEEVKQKSKTTKKSHKVKFAQKESDKEKQVKIDEDEIEIVAPKKSAKKDKKAKDDKIENLVASSVEKITLDSSAEWKKVNKPIKKLNKKETNVDESTKESVMGEVEAVQENVIVVEKTDNIVKSKKTNKKDANKNTAPKVPSKSESIIESDKQSEIQVKQHKEKVAVEVQVANEEMDLRRRIGELMSELDKQKSVNKEENKTSTQTINQLNKELETTKQKVKISQTGEEKLMEDIKKKNASFSDFKQQYVIVQSELTKNIVQVQSLTRDKEKLERRIGTLDDSNQQLLEKSQIFDEINSEKENLKQRLSIVEEEYKMAKARFNESFQATEVELNGKITQLHGDKQQMQEQLLRVQSELIDTSSKQQKIQQELLNMKSTYSDLLNENMCLQKNYTDLENANILIREQQASESNLREQHNEAKMTSVLNELAELHLVHEEHVMASQTSMGQHRESLEQEKNAEILSLTEELESAKCLLASATDEAKSHKETCDKLVAEIEEEKKENIELQTAVEQLKAGLSDTECAILKLQASFGDEDIKYKESILQLESESEKKMASLAQELQSTKCLLAEAQVDSEGHKKSCESLVAEIVDLKNEKDDLVFLVTKYKSGLENTETILSNLQTSVNEEEAKWRENLQKSEKEAEESKNELERVYKDLMRIKNIRANKNELNFAYHCVDKSLSSLIDEMETRMNHFEASLEAVIQERDTALAQIHGQMNGNSTEEPHVNNVAIDESEVMKIKEDLANQIEMNKLLETRCIKYKSLVDIGKDALEAEKIQMETLREEMKLLQSKLPADSNHEML